MELGAIFEHIQRRPKQAQTALLSGLKLTDAKYTPAGAILTAMYLLTALGVLRRIDWVLGEEHTTSCSSPCLGFRNSSVLVPETKTSSFLGQTFDVDIKFKYSTL